MKSRKPRSFALAIIFGLCLQVIAAVPPPSFPLRVRGGGPLRVEAQRTQTPSLFKLVVEFVPGAGRADAGLRPGQGSWLDRAMRVGEPARLAYYVQEADAQSIIDYLRRPGSYYTFECYNTGKGYMQVTKAYTKSGRID